MAELVILVLECEPCHVRLRGVRDLMQDVVTTCPKCGQRMTPAGVDRRVDPSELGRK